LACCDRAWLLLAIVVSIAGSSGLIIALYTLLAFAAYVLVMLIVLRPILAWLSKYAFSSITRSHCTKLTELTLSCRTVNTHNTMKHEFVILILALLFISAWITDVRTWPSFNPSVPQALSYIGVSSADDRRALYVRRLPAGRHHAARPSRGAAHHRKS
jgi:hypothetical protein